MFEMLVTLIQFFTITFLWTTVDLTTNWFWVALVKANWFIQWATAASKSYNCTDSIQVSKWMQAAINCSRTLLTVISRPLVSIGSRKDMTPATMAVTLYSDIAMWTDTRSNTCTHTVTHTHTHTHTSITSHWTAVVLQWLNFQNKVPDLLSCLLWWKSPFENLQYVTPAESFELRKCEKLPGPSIQLTADLADEVMDATQVAGGVGSQSGIELCTRWFTNCFRHHRF